jgi:mannose-1-phosphate guanylyltransferase / mannose-6-phosphate isomerase
MKALILAGGSGTRLWPYSRTEFPKQFLKIGDESTLLQTTISRILNHFSPEDVFILTNRLYHYAMKTELSLIHPVLEKNIILEPCQKNTAPAIAFALKYLIELRGCAHDETVFVSPSDHRIAPQDRFCFYVERALKIAEGGRIATFGICPTSPETGYGYIEAGPAFNEDAFVASRFVEKPDLETAKRYIDAGNFYWNSGMFAFQIKTMQNELAAFCPEIALYFEKDLDEFESHFEKMPNLSIDYAVMEKSTKTVLLPIDLCWSDVASWDSMYDLLPKDASGNALVGEVVEMDTKDTLILGDKRLVAAIGLEDMLVVETPDVVLVAKKKESQKVKEVVARLKIMGRKEIKEHLTTHRPWGSFTILDTSERYKIKKIFIHPGHTLSLQMHFHRSEHWVVVKGTAKVTIQGKETLVHENESIYVPKGAVHRVSNPGKVPLEIIETQVGEYLGEDDIVRLEDIYGRTAERQSQTSEMS